jgi:hypothetical protein
LIELSADLLSQWHPSLNIPLTIDTLTSTSRKVWWLGGCGHSWEASVFDRKRGYGCSYCAGKKILIGFNDLASKNPTLAAEWHPTKNLPLSPETVSHRSSAKKFWWVCFKGHEWQSKILHRANGSGCPVCAGRKTLNGFNDLATTHPEIAALWHPTRNAELTPSDVTAGSGKKVWWICALGHETVTTVDSKVSLKINCYYCSGSKVLKGFNDLQSQRPDLVAEWHCENNGDIKPDEVHVGSSSKFWWKCKHEHTWLTTVSSRAGGTGCPVCCGNKALAGFNDFASKSPELAKEWHPTKNGDKKPTDFTFSSGIKVWWLGKCGHEWKAAIANRNNGTGCPVCAGKIVVIGFNDLASKSPDLAAEWHPNKNLPLYPNMVTSASPQKIWWECDRGHEWQAAISQRAQGSGCPECWVKTYISKPEEEIKQFLTNLGLDVVQSDRKVLRGKEIDLYIEDKKFGIEFNGLFWHNDNHKRDNHHYDKWVTSQQAGITLIQIWEDDWRDRKHVILRALAHKLGVSDKMSQYYPELAEHTSKLGARKTSVKILTTKIAREFLDRNHIQGFASGSYYLGLTDTSDVLRAVMVLKKEANNRLNIIRYATFGNIQGGFTKILKFAIDSYHPDSFVTFADHCISDGSLYETHGFVVDKMIPPDYMYVVQNTRKHKFGYRLAKFRDSSVLKYEDGLTERELAKLNKIPRIWDAGKTRYVLTVKTL